MSKVALIQMVSSSHIEDNLKQVARFMGEAREAEAKLVVLPENFAFMGLNETAKVDVAEVHGQGSIQNKISQLAREMGLWVIAGTIPLKSSGTKIRASCLVYDDTGLEVARYDKIHLFDVVVSEAESHQESKTIERGQDLAIIATPVGVVGLAVCYDLRFPELFYQLSLQGAQLFALPSAFTAVTGLAHWDILVRARAIEHLSYMLAVNQGGHHENGRHTFGHSVVVEPWGKVIAEATEGASLITADIDLMRLAQLRRQFPVIDHHVLGTVSRSFI
jgi:deaminated glutathione amidase